MEAAETNKKIRTADKIAQINASEDDHPIELLRWAVENSGDRAAIITSFQDTGCAMIDMAHKANLNLRVVTVDTLRLHKETYELIDRIEKHYGIEIERFKPDPEKLSPMVEQHGEYLFFDSKAKQEFCCKIRKVEPNQRALDAVDVWITGLRRDHSSVRESTHRASFIIHGGRKIIKLCPLVNWDREQVWKYLTDNDVPVNKLYELGYKSIGCDICSTPTLPHEDHRAGRWRWFNHHDEDHKECGIHIDGSGI